MTGEQICPADIEVARNATEPEGATPLEVADHNPAVRQEQVAALIRRGHSFLAGANPSAALQVFQEARAWAPNNLGIHNEAAYLLHRLGRLSEAETAFREILSAAPSHGGALAGLGYILRERGLRLEALAAFEGAATAEPARPDYTIEIAHELRALGRSDKAVSMYRDALLAAPDRTDARLGLAQALRERGDSAGALAAFEAAARAEPRNFEARNAIGHLLRQMERPVEAEAIFAGMLAENPAHEGALLGLGYIRNDQGEFSDALEAFENAATLAPHNPSIRIQIAYLRLKLNQPIEAEAMFHRVLEDAPNSISAMVEIAKLKQARGDRAGAAAVFEAALAKNPNSASLRVEFGYLLREAGQIKEARNAFEAALLMEPTLGSALGGLGWLMIDAYRLDDAQAFFSKALEADPGNIAPRMALGHVARRRGDRTMSLVCFEAALSHDPENIDAKLECAAELRDRGLFTQARKIVDAAILAKPSHIAARLQLVQLHETLGEPAAALRAAEAALRIDPFHSSALLATAAAHWRLGEPRQAEDIVRRALERDPNNLEALIRLADYAMAAEDFYKAQAIAMGAAATHPHRIWPYLQAARAAAHFGEAAAASAFLDDAVRHCGAQPEIAATRIQLAREAREWSTARQAIARAPHSFERSFFFWSEAMLVAIAIGDFDAANAGLARAPAGSTKGEARIHLFRAQLFEAQRRYDEAIGEYEAAARLDATDSWAYGELARARLINLDLEGAMEALRMSVRLDASGHVLRGQSPNPSQHPLGQIIDEFALDRDVLRRLQDVLRAPNAERSAPLRALVRQNPEQTAPAMMLLIFLRQSGQFNPTINPEEASAKIPRRIIQFWDSAEPPPDIQTIMQSWRDRNPDFAYHLFDDASAKAFIMRRFPIDVVRAFARARHPAQRADIFRLAYLCAEGGFYVDADDRCLAPIQTFAPPAARLALYQENYGTIGNDFIGAAPDHPVIARALALAVEAMTRGDSDTLWLSTGPGLLTRAFAQAVAGVIPEMPDWRQGTIVRELDEAQRAIGLHCPVFYKHTNKHWTRATDRKFAVRAK
jgi:tetratricopeptide (TPR) repeat protein/mannosyltransferase OCH1-like enzyme